MLEVTFRVKNGRHSIAKLIKLEKKDRCTAALSANNVINVSYRPGICQCVLFKGTLTKALKLVIVFYAISLSGVSLPLQKLVKVTS